MGGGFTETFAFGGAAPKEPWAMLGMGFCLFMFVFLVGFIEVLRGFYKGFALGMLIASGKGSHHGLSVLQGSQKRFVLGIPFTFGGTCGSGFPATLNPKP